MNPLLAIFAAVSLLANGQTVLVRPGTQTALAIGDVAPSPSNPDPDESSWSFYAAFEQTDKPSVGFTPDSSVHTQSVDFFLGTAAEPLHIVVTNSPLNHAFTFAAGDGLTAYNFDGLSNNVRGTASLWFKSSSDNNSIQELVWVGTLPFTSEFRIVIDSRSTVDELSYNVRVDGSLKWNIITTGDFVDSFIGDGIWHNVAVVHDGTNPIAFFDGALLAPIITNITTDITAWLDAVGSAVTPGTNISIGHRPNGTRSFVGDIDEVKFYTKAMSSNEVLEIYLNSNPTNRIWDQPTPQ